jgi:hypothetical protein
VKIFIELNTLGVLYCPILNGFFFVNKIHVFVRVFLAILSIIALFAVIKYFTRRGESTDTYLIINHKSIPWSKIDHIGLRQSPLGNQYLAVYFKDGSPPTGFDMEYLSKKEELIKGIKENALQKGFTFLLEE